MTSWRMPVVTQTKWTREPWFFSAGRTGLDLEFSLFSWQGARPEPCHTMQTPFDTGAAWPGTFPAATLEKHCLSHPLLGVTGPSPPGADPAGPGLSLCLWLFSGFPGSPADEPLGLEWLTGRPSIRVRGALMSPTLHRTPDAERPGDRTGYCPTGTRGWVFWLLV